jgi:hypothetical protein
MNLILKFLNLMVVNFYFDINMTYFLNSHFALLYLHDKLSVIILRGHYEYTCLKKSIHIF